jgi:3',5'-cyclic AMP phosphodiesterase CpdA
MDAPKIALRFRETTPDIDTFTEHRAIINDHGAVLWGWWKKKNEEVNLEEVHAALGISGGAPVYLIDRETKRAFLAHCVGFMTGAKAEEQAEYVPQYYRKYIRDIAGFLLLDHIELIEDAAKYPAEIAAAFGETTFVWTEKLPNPEDEHGAEPAKAEGRSRILHLSDLHFGKDYGFRRQDDRSAFDSRKTLTQCLVSDLTALGCLNDIAAVIVTGDFMTAGEWEDEHIAAALSEFDALRHALHLEPTQIIAVPGNHDIVRYLKSDKGDEGKSVSIDTIVADTTRANEEVVVPESTSAPSQSIKEKTPSVESKDIPALTDGAMEYGPDPFGPKALVTLADEAVDAQVDMKYEQPFREFVQKLSKRHPTTSLNYVRRVEMGELDLLICALNSCVISRKTNWTQYGFVGEGSKAIEKLEREEIRKPTFRFMALHHHLLPVADIEYPGAAGVSLTLDASDVLLDAQRAGVNVVLHGHQHKPKVTRYQAIPLVREMRSPEEDLDALYVVANGSAGVTSDRHRLPVGSLNTYCLFRLTSDAVELLLREYRPDGRPGDTLFNRTLKCIPAKPV